MLVRPRHRRGIGRKVQWRQLLGTKFIHTSRLTAANGFLGGPTGSVLAIRLPVLPGVFGDANANSADCGTLGDLAKRSDSEYIHFMSQTIRAIYENGVFKPLETLDLPEFEQVRLTVEPIASASPNQGFTDPLAGLRASTGISDLADNFDDYRFGKRRP